MRTLFLACSLVFALSSCAVEGGQPVGGDEAVATDEAVAADDAETITADETENLVPGAAAAAAWAPCRGSRFEHCYTYSCTNGRNTWRYWWFYPTWLHHVEVGARCTNV